MEAAERHDSQAKKQSQMTKVETRNLSEGMGPLCLRVLLVVEESKLQRRKKKDIDRTVEPVHRGEGRTAEDEAEERLDRQEQHDVGGDPR